MVLVGAGVGDDVGAGFGAGLGDGLDPPEDPEEPLEPVLLYCCDGGLVIGYWAVPFEVIKF